MYFLLFLLNKNLRCFYVDKVDSTKRMSYIGFELTFYVDIVVMASKMENMQF